MKTKFKVFLSALFSGLRLLIVFFAVSYLCVAIFGHNNIVKVLGFEFAIVKSGSMKPTISTYDFIVVNNNLNNLSVGDIVVFYDSSIKNRVVHRIVNIENINEQIMYVTKGDNNATNDPVYKTKDDIYAKYSFTIPYLGLLITFLTSSVGIAVMLIDVINLLIIHLLLKQEKAETT